ncbi:transporter substrate-binding domain-containing protein [Plastoroseomonas arctica]|uniref:Transporter substrate-binding domain-containing protein n=1 Tax=Plastoroseomonas arctica TaxID=1509237 RepID=A0AAF1KNW5_9PROT|nr:transporter substrate-binding domain-containing protein [Plastoroseomonas arctica]MBR0655123.1 transporter substrate-binding domain-containing protein [Plastoroseomonas arctica]
MSLTLSRRALLGAGVLTLAAPRIARAQAVTLAALRASGKLRIGIEATYPPFTMRESGVITGHDIELGTIMCRSLGITPEYVDVVWSGVIPALYAGRFDMIMSGMSYTRARMERVSFSIPYAEAGQSLLIRNRDTNTIRAIEDMSGKVLGIKLGSPGETLHPRLAERITAARGRGFADVKIYDDHPAAYLALNQGTVDGVLNTLPTLAYVIRSQPTRFAVIRGIGADNYAGFACRKDDTEIHAWMDEQLRTLRANGTLRELQLKYFGLEFNLPETIPEPVA